MAATRFDNSGVATGLPPAILSTHLAGNVTIETMVKATHCLGSRLHLNLSNEQAKHMFLEVFNGKPQPVQADRKFSAAAFARVGEASGDVAKVA